LLYAKQDTKYIISRNKVQVFCKDKHHASRTIIAYYRTRHASTSCHS
jgi:hypothetical protein